MSFIFTISIAVIVFGTIYWIRERRSEKVIKTDHEFFSRLWLWPRGEHTRWEAEYDIISIYTHGTIGMHAEDRYETSETPQPTAQEVDFCKDYISDLTLLFPIALDGVKQGWHEWFQEELPEKWPDEFVVDGFSVPAFGDVKNKWGIMLFCEKAGHFFNLVIENGNSKLESIDG